jgi:hypothetical protein
MKAESSDPPRSEESMAGHEVLFRALLNRKTERLEDVPQIAEDAGVTEDQIFKWTRPPETAKNRKGTGRRNPIDYFMKLLRAVYMSRPAKARLILKYVLAQFAEWEERQGREGLLVVWPKEIDANESDTDQKRRRAEGRVEEVKEGEEGREESHAVSQPGRSDKRKSCSARSY